MKLLSRSTLVLFIIAASALRCAANTYTVGPGLAVGIPDNGYNGTLASMASVNIVVPDSNTIDDLNVTIGMIHTWVGDLTIKLKSPSGTIVTLVSRPGAAEGTDNGVDPPFGDSSNLSPFFPITFDDSATTSAELMGSTIGDTAGSNVVCDDDGICEFIPDPDAAAAGNLASFDGQDTAGTWTLYIGDSGPADTGTIDTVTLTFTNAAATECRPPPANMIAWWPGDTNARDIAGIHNGTLQGDATIGAGKVDNGFSFDGTGDYVDVGDVDLPATFTIDAWINPTSLTGGPFIIAKNDGGSVQSYFLQVFAGGQLEAIVHNGAAGVTEYTSTTSPVTTGSWQHVAMTYDGNAAAGQKIKFYYNGAAIAATVQGGQDAGGTPNNIPDPALIGAFSGPTSGFNGAIDELELFNRVLSAGEIQSIFAADTFGKCKPEIYVSNSGNDSIQQFDADAFGAPFATTGMDSPSGLAFDSGGNLFVANHDNGSILKFDSNGTSTAFVAAGSGPQFFAPYGIAFDNAGNLFAADPGTNKIIKFDPASSFSTFADSTSGLIAPVGVAFDGAGNLYVANFGDGTIIKFDPQGTVSPVADIGGANEATDIAFDKDGNLFVAAQTVNKIFKIDTGNTVTEFADSTDGISNPFGLAFDRFENLFVLNKVNTAGPEILKFDAAGNHVTFAGPPGLSVPAFIEIKPGIVPLPAPTPVARRFVNISTRASVGTGDNVAIAGFIPKFGEPTSPRPNSFLHPKTVLIRGLGPSLNVLGVPVAGRLANPVLELRDGNHTLLASNDNWRVPSQNETEVLATGLAPADDNESALVITLDSDLPYTVILSGAGNTTGIGLVEVYDLDPLGETHLANISTRGQVLTGDDVLIGGVIVRGGDDRQIIFRALGPSLANFSVNNPLLDPQLDIHDGQGTLIAHNDDWKEEPDGTPNAPREALINATGLAPTNDAEAAILYSGGLAPGNYTAIVSGVGGDTGVGMVEAYRLGPPPGP